MDNQNAAQIDLTPIFLNPEIMRFYANGFIVSTSAADFAIILQTNGRIDGILHLSYTATKSLAESLTKSISEFERLAEVKIHTSTEIQNKVQSNIDKSAALLTKKVQQRKK